MGKCNTQLDRMRELRKMWARIVGTHTIDGAVL